VGEKSTTNNCNDPGSVGCLPPGKMVLKYLLFDSGLDAIVLTWLLTLTARSLLFCFISWRVLALLVVTFPFVPSFDIDSRDSIT